MKKEAVWSIELSWNRMGF